jgi:hypothetical protein
MNAVYPRAGSASRSLLSLAKDVATFVMPAFRVVVRPLSIPIIGSVGP